MNKQPIIFQVIDWREYNEDIEIPSDYYDNNVEMKNKYLFRIFGRTPCGKSIHIKCIKYIPHFYVKIPKLWLSVPQNKNISESDWLKHCCNAFINELKKRNYGTNIHYLKYDIVDRSDFRGFTADKCFKFLRIVFDNSKAMKNFAYTLNNKISIPTINNDLIKYDIYENNIDSMIRAGHIQDLKFAGFIKLSKYYTNDEIESTTCDINLLCDWTDLKPLSEDEYKNMISVPFKIAGYDIECDSSDGNFPRPTPTTHDQNGNKLDIIRPGDKVIQIGTVFSTYGGDIYKKHIITLGTCDAIDGVEVVSVNSERELLIEWAKLIQKEDPDFLVGYNIFGFDDDYLYTRASQPEIACLDVFDKMSKIKSYNCINVKQQLNTNAQGDNLMKYIDCHGRIKIDLMKIIQRDYKLTKYNLDFVAETFIQENITSYELSDNNTVKFKSKNLHNINIGNYIKLIDNAAAKYGLVDEHNNDINNDKENDNINNNDGIDDSDEEDIINNDIVKYKILDIMNDEMIIINKNNTITKSYMAELGKDIKWGLVKDDIKPNMLFALQKGNSTDRSIIAKYCIQDCVLVIRLLNKLEIITNHIAMANVSNIPFNYLLTRGQGIKGLSLVAKECRKSNYLLPYLKVPDNNELDSIKYEGAIVFEPYTGFYQSPIFVLDFNSLYPSSIISYNVSHETIVVNPTYDNLPNYNYKNITYNNNDGTTTTCRYAHKNDGTFGILPRILMNLLNERKNTKKLMKNEKDPFKKSILDGHQNALKITANSAYGLLGTNKSPIGFIELAASTTAIGRSMLSLARDFVEKDLLNIMHQYNDVYNIYKNDVNIYKNEINKLNNLFLYDKSDENITFITTTIPQLFATYTINIKVIYGDTDSIFCNPNLTDIQTGELLKTKKTINAAIKIGQLASIFVKKHLLFPHNLEYEKTFYPFCLMAKKKYVGNKYEDDDAKCKLTYMGIVLKRRDNANIVKKVLGGLVNIMMYENDIDKAKRYLHTMCRNLLDGKYSINDFITTKALKSTYKGTKLTTTNKGNENDIGRWYWDDVKCGQAHVKLCQRIKERDPGNVPNVNDRISMVVIYKPKKRGIKYLQGDLVDTPEYIKEHNIQIDYLFYLTNQIMNPVIQFAEHIFSNCNEAKDMFNDYIIEEEKKRKGIKKLNITTTPYIPIIYYDDNTDSNINENINNNIIDCPNIIVKPYDPKDILKMPLPKKPKKKRADTKLKKTKLNIYLDPNSEIETN